MPRPPAKQPRSKGRRHSKSAHRRACFDNQDLRGSDFSGLDLSEATFRGANLDGANLNQCTMFAANLTGATLNDASLIHCDFLDAIAIGITAHKACFQNASLMSADFSGADLSGSDLNYAFVAGTNLTNADLTGAGFTHTTFQHAALSGASIGGTFNGTTLVDVDLASALGWTRAFHASSSYVDFRTLGKSMAGAGSLSPDNARALRQFFVECGVPESLVAELTARGYTEPKPRKEAYSLSEIDPHDARLDPLDRYIAEDSSHLALARRTLQALLETNPQELELQRLLSKFPELLVHRIGGGGHGRWVIPQLRFGGDHTADFVVGTKDSSGYHWHLVELEGCDEALFTKKGDPAKMLNHGVRQVRDWRIWLEQNLGVARRERADRGLGLRDIEPDSPGIVLIGRRSMLNEHTTLLRRRMARESRIEIHTYDWLLRE